MVDEAERRLIAAAERAVQALREVLDPAVRALEALALPVRAVDVDMATDHEITTWPICTPAGDWAGGVWCADEDCPLQAESSEIGDFQERTFTLGDLHAAIAEHIARRRERAAGE